MYSSIWLYLKEMNMNCTCKLTDIHKPGKVCKDRNNKKILKKGGSCRENNNGREFLLSRRERSRMVKSISFRRSYSTQDRFYQLNVGDPSRNVIEMIFQTATTSKHANNIERVLRVKNSTETLERFEEYREMVKNIAHCNSVLYHPRSVVDGNEVLRFYKTTMNCCSRKLNKVSELCNNPKCGVCIMIRMGFDMEDTKKTRIQLNADCEILGEDDCGLVSVDKGETVKRAVVVCRVIAGMVVNTVEGGNGGGRYDSVLGSGGGLCSKLEDLFVRDSNAVLPCFVIVFA